MISFWRIFSLEWTALVRSRTLHFLALAGVGWLFAFPRLVTGDGTPEGFRELYLHYAPGGVFALLVLVLVSVATGSIAHERAVRRLQLTLVRPVRPPLIALAKTLALTVAGAAVLALAFALVPVAWRGAGGLDRPCAHVLRPLLPTPQAEAEAAYAEYMADPKTPAAVRAAPRAVVLRLLANRAWDRYETVATNAVMRWTFASAPQAKGTALPGVRFRFSTAFNSRETVCGVFRADGWHASVSNVTQSVLEVPLSAGGAAGLGIGGLSFYNGGRQPLMLRPRRDVELLLPADGLGWNLLRTYFELVALLALAIAFGVFLGSGLGRPVALFVAIVTLLLGEISPSVIEQYPDALETNPADRIGLFFTRFAAETTRPFAALDPLARLSRDVCVERTEVLRVWVADGIIAVLLLSLLAGLAMPAKRDP